MFNVLLTICSIIKSRKITLSYTCKQRLLDYLIGMLPVKPLKSIFILIKSNNNKFEKNVKLY